MAKTMLQQALEYHEYECFEYNRCGMKEKCLAVRLAEISKLARMGLLIGEYIAQNDMWDYMGAIQSSLSSLEWNNMGYDFVVYFPNVIYFEDECDEEDDDE